jgi:GntR family transcriptional regulator
MADMAKRTAPAGSKPVAGPAYRRILEEIRLRIEDGALKPGDRLESERELARRCDVSLMTARHAMKELEGEGLVVRRVGAGTYVAPPKIHFNRLLSFSEQMASRGVTASSTIVSVRVVEAEPELAARLGLATDSRLLKLERIRFGGDDPFAFETTYLSHDDFPLVARSPRAHDSLFETLQREYQLVPAYADEEVDATAADGRIAEYLQVPRGSPVLRIRQVLFSTSGRKLLYDVGIYRSDRHSLTIRRFR